MLADRRATRFMNDFAGQWLKTRNINAHDPDRSLFRGFNDTLRKAMLRETELFFESQVREDRPIPELLRADYTYLNEQLARYYGVSDIYGPRFRRVELADDRRHGLLGHASILTVTSYANRTSVVLRGKWVLENLLGAPPPPPPPNVPPLEENDPAAAPTSLREKMEQHRGNPVCASCHAKIDPLGFAMEHFDAVGRWRDTDGGASIDSTIVWNDQTIDSPRAFREALLGQGNEFLRTVAEKLLSYAIGRTIELLRRADRSPSGAQCGTGRRPLVFADRGDRKERAVSTAARTGGARGAGRDRRPAAVATKESSMFISKVHIPRRTVLRGIGASLALPLLDSMVPALTAASKTAAAPVRRLGVFYIPNGMSMPYWSPKQEGPLTELPPTLRSLAGFEDRVLMCGGLNDAAANLVAGGGDHSRSAGRSSPVCRTKRRPDPMCTPRCPWIRSPRSSSPRRRSWPRSRWGSSRTRCSGPAMPRAAPTPTRSPGGRRPRRCLPKTTRGRSSNACLERAGAPIRRLVSRVCARTAASSTQCADA